MNKDFIFYTVEQNKIRATVYGYKNLAKQPLLIFVHGFKGFKDWGFIPYLGELFAYHGFCVLTFNFSHNGIGKKAGEFTELDKFADNTVSLELSELEQIIEAYQFSYFGRPSDKGIYLLGHSLGGGLSILAASQIEEVTGLITWNAVSHFNRYTEHQKEEWRKKGTLDIINTRTNQVMPMNVSYLDDLEENEDVLDVEKAVPHIHKPFLIIHGEQDLTVPFKEGQRIFELADKNFAKFMPVEGSGHTFDCVHPFEGANKKFDAAVNATLEFLKKQK